MARKIFKFRGYTLEELQEMSLDEVIAETIEGMRECAEAIGLKGEL